MVIEKLEERYSAADLIWFVSGIGASAMASLPAALSEGEPVIPAEFGRPSSRSEQSTFAPEMAHESPESIQPDAPETISLGVSQTVLPKAPAESTSLATGLVFAIATQSGDSGQGLIGSDFAELNFSPLAIKPIANSLESPQSTALPIGVAGGSIMTSGVASLGDGAGSFVASAFFSSGGGGSMSMMSSTDFNITGIVINPSAPEVGQMITTATVQAEGTLAGMASYEWTITDPNGGTSTNYGQTISLWFPTTGSYTLEVTGTAMGWDENMNMITASDFDCTTVSPAPYTIDFDLSPITVTNNLAMVGDMVSASVTGTGMDASMASYEWTITDPQSNLSHGTGTTIAVPTNRTGNYQLEVTGTVNMFGSSKTVTKSGTVAVNPYVASSISVSASQWPSGKYYVGDTVSYTLQTTPVNMNGTGLSSIEWRTNKWNPATSTWGPWQTLGTGMTTLSWVEMYAGTFTVEARIDSGGSLSSASTQITITPFELTGLSKSSTAPAGAIAGWSGEGSTYTYTATTNAIPVVGTFTWEYRKVTIPGQGNGVGWVPPQYSNWMPIPGAMSASQLIRVEDVPMDADIRVTLNSGGVITSREVSAYIAAAYPVNFRNVTLASVGLTAPASWLRVAYQYDSSSGSIADLDGVKIGEYVWYTTLGYYTGPWAYTFTAPFNAQDQDGYYLPQGGVSAEMSPYLVDDHGQGFRINAPGTTSLPVSATANQYYWYAVTDHPLLLPWEGAPMLQITTKSITYTISAAADGGVVYTITKGTDGTFSETINTFPWP